MLENIAKRDWNKVFLFLRKNLKHQFEHDNVLISALSNENIDLLIYKEDNNHANRCTQKQCHQNRPRFMFSGISHELVSHEIKR